MRIIFLFFVMTVLSCTGYEPMMKTRTNYIGNNLRLDGYYYCLGRDFWVGFHEDYSNFFFLNQNGTFFNVTGGPYNLKLNKEELLGLKDKTIKNLINDINYVEYRPRWGVFSVEDSNIVIERWNHSSSGGAFPTQVLEGTIINDTTLHFHKLIGAYPNTKGGKKKVREISETYHFRQYSPKPDSVTMFIE